ncbi:hypothetical protein ZWY2020_046597 [Hordeum vulgare]|nr:hypothetical protein ZWY2020_046597 [Hordeum vulgare]
MNSSGMSVSFAQRAGDFSGYSFPAEEDCRGGAARGEAAEKTFVEEMRAVAMRMHTKDQSSEGEKEQRGPSLSELEPNLEAYLRFLVDSKLIFQTLENIVDRAAVPWFSEYWVREIEALKKDLKWLSETGHTIPEPSAADTRYASYLEKLSEKDQHAFFCHYYNMYFGQSAGGRMIGKKSWNSTREGTLSELLQNVREKLNQVASLTREEKNRCLEETETSFAYSGERLRKIFT